MKVKRIKKPIIAIAILIAAFFILTECCIYYYLKSYGYGIKELPQTTLVYFHLSKGFSVGDSGDFIGRHSDIYVELFEENGYFMSEQQGLVKYFKKAENKNDDYHHDFDLFYSYDWCHWFRVYDLGGDRKIEDFI